MFARSNTSELHDDHSNEYTLAETVEPATKVKPSRAVIRRNGTNPMMFTDLLMLIFCAAKKSNEGIKPNDERSIVLVLILTLRPKTPANGFGRNAEQSASFGLVTSNG